MNRVMTAIVLCMVLTAATYAELPVTEGLVVELRAEALESLQDGEAVTVWADLAGDDAVDGTVASMDGVTEPVFVSQASYGGPAVRFEVISGLVSGALDTGFDPGAGVTVLALCSGDRTGELDARIAEIGPIPAPGGGTFAFDVSTNIDYGPGFRLNNGYAVTSGSSVMTTGWHVGAWLAEQGGKHSDLVMYLDGVEQSLINNNPDNTATLPETGNVLTVGTGDCEGGLHNASSADLAVLLVYNRVLSEDEVLAVSTYLQGEYLPEEPSDFRETLIAHWPLDEGDGKIVADISGYENHGTIVGDCDWKIGTYGKALDLPALCFHTARPRRCTAVRPAFAARCGPIQRATG